jgi:hypothetical protein
VQLCMLQRLTARLDRHLPVLLGFLLLSLAFYRPPAAPSAGAEFFGGGQDPGLIVWLLNWWSFALTHGLTPVSTVMVDAPAGMNTVWTTSVPALGLGLAPLIRLCGALPVYNALMGMASPLAGFATYLAARELTARRAPAIAGGLLFALMPYQAGQAIGHLHLCFSAAVPLSLFLVLRAHHQAWPRWRLACGLGGLLAIEFGISQELCATLVLAWILTGGLLAWRYPPARAACASVAPEFAAALGIAAVLTAPLLWQMARFYGASLGELVDPVRFSSDLLEFVVPSPLIWWGGQSATFISHHFTGNYTEQSAYLGVPLIFLLGAIARHPGVGRIAVMAVLGAATLSLGPFLQVAGLAVSTAPWLAAYHLPLLHDMLPARFSIYIDLAAALAVACWLCRPGLWRFGVVALCALPILPAPAADRAWVHLTLPPAIAALPPGTNLTILPLFGQEMGLQYLAGMRFKLVGQGYLTTGLAAPFASWPLYPDLWNNRFDQVDPAQFAKFLHTYGTDDVAVLPTGYDYATGLADKGQAFAAAQTLLRQAGWRAVTSTDQAVIFTPSGPPLPWTVPTRAVTAGPPEATGLHRRLDILNLLALVSALLVWADARFRARRADAPVWLVGIFFGWIVMLPAYLFVRFKTRRRWPV